MKAVLASHMIIATFHWLGGHNPDISSQEMAETREKCLMIMKTRAGWAPWFGPAEGSGWAGWAFQFGPAGGSGWAGWVARSVGRALRPAGREGVHVPAGQPLSRVKRQNIT